jgi:hypothetical protein
MSKVVPSQIVEFIDKRYPAVREQLDGKGQSFSLDFSKQGTIYTIIHLIDQLPDNLLRLKENDQIYFLEAYHELKSAIALWNSGSGGTKYEITKMKDGSRLNPVTVIRDCLSRCPDQGYENSTTELTFIEDQDFNEIIIQDINFVNEALSNSEWKASTVLAGSVIEALLLFSIKKFRDSKSGEYKKAIERALAEETIGKPLKTKPSGNPDSWYLSQYIYLAYTTGLISENTAKECLLSKDFRNLIHQGAAERKKQKCDRGTAHLAIAAMEHVINDLTKYFN